MEKKTDGSAGLFERRESEGSVLHREYLRLHEHKKQLEKELLNIKSAMNANIHRFNVLYPDKHYFLFHM